MTKVIFSAKIQRVKTFRNVRFLSKIKTENVWKDYSFWSYGLIAIIQDIEERKKSVWLIEMAEPLFLSTSEVLVRILQSHWNQKWSIVWFWKPSWIWYDRRWSQEIWRGLRRPTCGIGTSPHQKGDWETSSILWFSFSFPFSFFSYIEIFVLFRFLWKSDIKNHCIIIFTIICFCKVV